MKRVIAVGYLDQCRPPSETLDDFLQELWVRQGVTRTLDEEHWNRDGRQMVSSFRRWLSGRMERPAEEREAHHAGQRRIGLSLRCHPPTE